MLKRESKIVSGENRAFLLKMKSVNLVQIFEDAVCVLFCANVQQKGVNTPLIPQLWAVGSPALVR